MRVGEQSDAVTGEEKIIPPAPRFWSPPWRRCPPTSRSFQAIDESSWPPTSSVAMSSPAGCSPVVAKAETMLLGAGTMRGLIERLLPNTNFISRPRFSKLSYSGQKKLTRLPRRAAIVAFSAEMVAAAELIRRQRGGGRSRA